MYWAIKTLRYPILDALQGAVGQLSSQLYNLANFLGGNLYPEFNSNEVRNICVNKLEKFYLHIDVGALGCWCELIA